MKKWFEKICIGLHLFSFRPFADVFWHTYSGKTIAFARAERIEVINNLWTASAKERPDLPGKKDADGGVRVPQGVFAGSGRL